MLLKLRALMKRHGKPAQHRVYPDHSFPFGFSPRLAGFILFLP